MKILKWFKLGLITFFTIIPRYFLVGVYSFINPQKSKELKYKGKPIIPIIVLCVTISTYLVCIFIISRWYVQKLKLNFLIDDIVNSTAEVDDTPEEIEYTEYYPKEDDDKYANVSFLTKDFDELLKKNKETVGWIKVNNTNVNYPVVQHSDNKYYLKHDFNQRSNGNGWVYADYRDDFTYFGTNSIIYAHNLTNRTMFGSLVWCLKESWYTKEENQYIKISTPTSNTIWKLFSIYTVIPESYYIKTYFATDEERETFISTIKGRSIYNFNEDVNIEDKILTLSTCTDDGRKRVVIHSKMVKIEYK